MHPIPAGDSPSPSIAMNQLHLPPLSQTRSYGPMLYYGVLVVGAATVVLALYNLIIVKWRWRPASSSNKVSLGSSFKYKRDDGAGEDSECVVCLSVFKEGEELRQLPKCNHSFHTACIDMWLCSHMDCPLCRCAVELPGVKQRPATPEHYSQGMLVPVALV